MADIMIVDDEPTIQQLMAIILEDMGHRVIAQSLNGEMALQTYLGLQTGPDLLIIDHRMPIMSGTELAKAVLENNPVQKILFLTADESVKETVNGLGITNFLEKPADINTIREAVTRALS
ncbi:MAG: response regulator [Candidatus Thermoplasmatota archaeon]|nr:response regulator [Candidatus Thermoplasmatota archaeon]